MPVGDHFYTTSAAERDNAIAFYGYVPEGIACFVYPLVGGDGAAELFRLYNPGNGDHFYALSTTERDTAVASGYLSEGIGCLAYAMPQSGTVPFFRLYNPGNGDHFYTTSTTEVNSAIAGGYVSEGTACHVYSGPGSQRTELFRLYNPGNGDHFYTTSAAERDSAAASGYVVEGAACYVPTTLPDSPPVFGTIPLFRLYNPGNGDHFYTTSAAERDTAAGGGYSIEGVACYVFGSATEGTTPLFRLYNPGNGDHFYTISAAERDSAVSGGYVSEGAACWVFAGSRVRTTPFFRLYRPVEIQKRIRIHFKMLTAPATFTTDAMLLSMRGVYNTAGIRVDLASVERLSLPDLADLELNIGGYNVEGTACFVPSASGAGTVSLFRLYNPGNGDHFYTTSAAERDSAITVGYVSEGVACLVFGAAAAGRIPLFRLYNPGNGDHFYTISAAERDSAINGGYISEGTACWVFPAMVAGSVPLFRMYNPGNGDHFYTTSAAEVNAAGIGCVGGQVSPEQVLLFGNRTNVQDSDITIYFIRTTSPPLNGCASHPEGQPGAVVTQMASMWTLAHEVGHVLGLNHISGEHQGCPAANPQCCSTPDSTRLMTGCGTGLITSTPTLSAVEITTMLLSSYVLDL
jgi:hypothetical protein